MKLTDETREGMSREKLDVAKAALRKIAFGWCRGNGDAYHDLKCEPCIAERALAEICPMSPEEMVELEEIKRRVLGGIFRGRR